ncbi:toll/interleukin-1 receptor domain-containing protein [Aureimonas sp. AU12]|uniref:toll/interleukin-1 receptor domain-containing protein n=1 Tax=Aureimonas sp. AU12 TaxID=1638161 RepID=UPI000780C80C|nr:toll/interleukin-1 receptor domain-containing protein [Aureimonas sp. AU12]
MTITIFVSYSHPDEPFRKQLDKHFAPLKHEGDVEFWHDDRIVPGTGLDPDIRKALRRSKIFLALVSAHYLASDYCFRREYAYALNRARRKTMRVVVALVGTCTWKQTRMAYYKCLPKDGKPVDQWGNRNKAYVDIAEGVRRVVVEVRKELKAASASEAPSPAFPKRKWVVGVSASSRAARSAGSKTATAGNAGNAGKTTIKKPARRKPSSPHARKSVAPSRRRPASAPKK